MQISVPIYQLKRRAKLLARQKNIPLHEALDSVASEQGFGAWSALSAQMSSHTASSELLPQLKDGDMLLLGARAGHGKTTMGLQLLIDAAREGRRAVFFTLEYTDQEAAERLQSLNGGKDKPGIEIVTSGDISADFIVQFLSGSAPGTVAIIDYLQILDQQRSKPPLSKQMQVLKEFAGTSGVILGFISQIDRGFETENASLPSLDHVRLPNPIPNDVFTKACFLHAGEARLQSLA